MSALLIVSVSALCLGQSLFVAGKSHSAASSSSANAPGTLSRGDWSELSKLMPGHPYTFNFGSSVAIAGDTVVVAAQNGYTAAYVFVKTSAGWGSLPVAGLSVPPDTLVITGAIAIDGDTIVIGNTSGGAGYPSYAYVYVKPAGGWTAMLPTAVLTPSDTIDGCFGSSVAINGDTIVVGDVGGCLSGTSLGSAYIFVKPPGGWVNGTQTAKLTASDTVMTDFFGASVSISGSTVAVGAPQFQTEPGKAYVYVQPASGWADMTQTAELTASDAQAEFEVGFSVSVSGDNILAGAPSIYNLNYPPGNAYLFTKPPGGWVNMTQTAELLPGSTRPGQNFGESVTISGNLAAVGAPCFGTPPNSEEGGIYIFQEPAGGWKNATGFTALTAADAHYLNLVGSSVRMSGKVFVTGSFSGGFPGKAYVFGLP
ncbi:MAG: hypothetical protein WCF74_00430 [Candidatus Sulfotelmatobacter sp.]